VLIALGYWEGRFQVGGKIWGDRPSKSAEIALHYFQEYGVRRIFIPGAGYGRNARLFSADGFHVDGVEQSPTAVDIAPSFDPASHIILGSVFEIPEPSVHYDAIYAFNIFHLFLASDRQRFLDICLRLLRPGGWLFLVVFSTDEPSFKKGAEIEPGTFESKPGRPVHYFSQDELIASLRQFSVRECVLIEDPEDHGEEGPHIHRLYYVLAQKTDCSADSE